MAEASEIEVIHADWPAPPNIRAFTTTRKGGFSQGPWSSLNLGTNCGDNPRCVEKNRQSLLRLLPSEPPWLDQVHGTEVTGWDKAKGAGIEADAIVSSEAGQVCAVLTADCLPVIFCDKEGTRIAAAHAGWRGLAAGVLEATVLAMGCKPSDLMAWLGPAIGPRAFEVGRDVFDAFANSNIENAIAFKPHRDRWLADLYQLARLSLARVGITQISGGQYCTYAEEDCFYSYRREGETGRLATVIWML
jgi:YfiH family protein